MTIYFRGQNWQEPAPAALASLQRYKAEPFIRAARIREVVFEAAGPFFIILTSDESIEVDKSMVARYMPEPGDAYVVYPDGYTAFLPRLTFEQHYAGRRDRLGFLRRFFRSMRAARRELN